MHKHNPNLPLAGLLDDPVQTPAGLFVSARSAEGLIKSEAKKLQQEQNKAAFFSKFALAANMVAYGAREKPAGTPQFSVLYEAATKSFVDAILIQARRDQTKRIWRRAMSGKNKEVGFRVVHERADDPDFKGSKEINERCREMEDLLSDPTPVDYLDIYPHQVRPHSRLKDFVSVATRAELVIDRKVMLRYRRRDGKGYAAFHWLPGDTIKNVDEAVRQWARENEPDKKAQRDTLERMSYATGFDITKAVYCQVIDGMVVAAFTPDEISVHISNPSDELNRYGYGTSRLELSLDVTTTLLYAWNYNKEMFKTNYPEQILGIGGSFDEEGLLAFKQQVLGEGGGVGNNWRLPVIPFEDIDKFDMKSVKLRESPKDMLFDNLLRLMVMFKAAAYGAHPQTLNLSTDSGGGGNSLFGANPESEIEFSQEQGLMPSLTDMCEWLTDAIVKPRYDDLKVIIVGLNPEDEKKVVELRKQRASAWLTRNEARMEEGLQPIGDVNDLENPWNYPADVAIPNYLNTFNMMGQQEDGDGQDDDQDKEEDDPVQKSVGARRQRQKKYLKISMGA